MYSASSDGRYSAEQWFSFMCHIDALVINDSEGLFQSPKRNDITGLGHTFVISMMALPPFEKQFSSATILISYITRFIPLLPAI